MRVVRAWGRLLCVPVGVVGLCVYVYVCAYSHMNLLSLNRIHPPKPNTPTVTHLTLAELMLCLASWGQYVLGMVIYAKGWPRLSPRHFSSHEVGRFKRLGRVD